MDNEKNQTNDLDPSDDLNPLQSNRDPKRLLFKLDDYCTKEALSSPNPNHTRKLFMLRNDLGRGVYGSSKLAGQLYSLAHSLWSFHFHGQGTQTEERLKFRKDQADYVIKTYESMCDDLDKLTAEKN
jgi:hypothetical protein